MVLKSLIGVPNYLLSIVYALYDIESVKRIIICVYY